MKVASDILAIIANAETDGNSLRLVSQIDRKQYTAVAKVIELAGGKWSRKAKAHLFDEDASAAIEPLLLTGEISNAKQDFGQFDTPAPLARTVVDLAHIKPGLRVLEPSAGIGNLVEPIEADGGLVEAFEIDTKRYYAARERCDFAGGLRLSNFLSSKPAPVFDRVVMNPPFAGQADVRHVMHAAKFLRPDGRLVAIMSSNIIFRENKVSREFREFISDRGGEIRPLPSGSFAVSGTNVNTAIVTMEAR